MANDESFDIFIVKANIIDNYISYISLCGDTWVAALIVEFMTVCRNGNVDAHFNELSMLISRCCKAILTV